MSGSARWQDVAAGPSDEVKGERGKASPTNSQPDSPEVGDQTSTIRAAQWAAEQQLEEQSRVTSREGDAVKTVDKKGLYMLRTISSNHQGKLSLLKATIPDTEKER